jgi:cytoskeletal protein CcmA (bactofilin family)
MAFKRPNPPSFATVPPELKPEQRWTANADRPTREGTSVIGSDLSIEGPSIIMRCKGSLRVDGNIEANLHCVELLIGERAVIVGSIAANKVAVSGRVNGAIWGDSVVLHSTAHVEGDISSCSLAIEQGATFDGRARKVTNPREVAPQLQPSPAAEIVVPFRS